MCPGISLHICANMGMFDMVFVWVKPYYECNRVKVQTPFFYPFSFSYGMTMIYDLDVRALVRGDAEHKRNGFF